jgi:hypothetical protein
MPNTSTAANHLKRTPLPFTAGWPANALIPGNRNFTLSTCSFWCQAFWFHVHIVPKHGISFLTKSPPDNIVDARTEIRLIGDTWSHKISRSNPTESRQGAGRPAAIFSPRCRWIEVPCLPAQLFQSRQLVMELPRYFEVCEAVMPRQLPTNNARVMKKHAIRIAENLWPHFKAPKALNCYLHYPKVLKVRS